MSTQVTLTIPDSLYVRAKHLAEARRAESTNELLDLLDQILASAGIDEEQVELIDDPEVEREMHAYLTLHPKLKKTHFGKHVAILPW